MANRRAAGQRAVIVMMDESFIEVIDANLAAMGFSDRSSFIRKAVQEKLGARAEGAITTAPPRAGKGGPKPAMLVRKEAEGYRVSQPKKVAKK